MIDILRLQDLFERDLQIVYDCERQLVRELSQIIDKVSSIQLQAAFNNDSQQATVHSERLVPIFAILHSLPVTEPDHALKGIFYEGEKLIKNIDRSALLDSALIIFGSQIHHHKIALYGSLRSLAETLGFRETVEALAQAMNDEKAAAETLMQIGSQSVNPDALKVRNTPHGWEIF
jgi:ferritin-like metal-binding protein YciE